MDKQTRNKIISLAIAGILIFQVGGTTANARIPHQWATQYINELKQNQLTNDYINKNNLTSKLDNPISKQDFLQLIYCSMNKNDVVTLNKQLESVYLNNIKDSITREEAVTIAAIICSLDSYNEITFSDKDKIKEDAYTYVSALQHNGIIVGYGNNQFNPSKKLTVAESLVITSKLINKGFITSNDVIDLAGNKSGYKDGEALQAGFNRPIGLCRDGKNGIIVVDSYNNLLRRIFNKKVETVAGKQTNKLDDYGLPSGGYRDAGIKDALFNRPQYADANANGDILVSDTENNCIRLISNSKVITLNGSTKAGYKDGKIKTALFNKPSDILFDTIGNVYVADTFNNCIRYIDMKKGEVTTFAGKQEKSGLKDGAVGESLFNQPVGLALDKNGAIYVSDSGNQRIRKIENGIVSTVAGSGDSLLEETGYIEGGYADGKKNEARFNFPCGIDIDANGVIFVADTGNHRIRAITKTSVITVAGSGEAGYLSGMVRASAFNEPEDILINDNMIYVSDSFNSKIRVINIDTSWK